MSPLPHIAVWESDETVSLSQALAEAYLLALDLRRALPVSNSNAPIDHGCSPFLADWSRPECLIPRVQVYPWAGSDGRGCFSFLGSPQRFSPLFFFPASPISETSLLVKRRCHGHLSFFAPKPSGGRQPFATGGGWLGGLWCFFFLVGGGGEWWVWSWWGGFGVGFVLAFLEGKMPYGFGDFWFRPILRKVALFYQFPDAVFLLPFALPPLLPLRLAMFHQRVFYSSCLFRRHSTD